MHTAAIAATSALQLQVGTWRQASAANSWLEKNGSEALEHLSLCADEPVGATADDTDVTVSLPWKCISQLKSLTFSGNMLVISKPPRDSSIYDMTSYSSSRSSDSDSEDGSSSNPLAVLTALTQLQINGCHTGYGFRVPQLKTLSALQRLELKALPNPRMTIMNRDPGGVIAFWSEEYGENLGQLVQLTALTLSSCDGWLGGAALAAASKLSKVQELTLGAVGSEEQPIRLQDLPSSLVDLNLLCCISTAEPDIIISSSWELPKLRSLQVQFAEFQPAALLHMLQLQNLHCSDVCVSHGQAMCMEDMFAVLPALQQLEHLTIGGCVALEGAAAAADYAALTASSHLTALQLIGCAMPAAAVQHMFAAGKLLPQLQCIAIAEAGRCDDVTDDMADAAEDYDMADAAGTDDITDAAETDDMADAAEDDEFDKLEQSSFRLGPGDALRIVRCCPGLQQVSCVMIDGEDVGAEDLQALLQLTALTNLSIGGHSVNDSVAEHVLAKLTGLSSLTVSSSPYLTAAGAAHLTCLTNLRALLLIECDTSFCADAELAAAFAASAGAAMWSDSDQYDSDAYDSDDVDEKEVWQDLAFVSEASAAHAPDVWQQLQQKCARNHAALTRMHEQAQRQLQQKEQQLQEQALVLQDRATQLEQLHVANQQLNTKVQHAREQAASAQARIEALERQLAEQQALAP